MAIGAQHDNKNKGTVRIYKYDASNKVFENVPSIFGDEGNYLGSSVALSDDGNKLAVGVPGKVAFYIYSFDFGTNSFGT